MKPDRRRRLWLRRRKGVRKKLARTERAILTVYRSNKHMYAQLVDPLTGKTLAGASTRSPAVREGLKSGKDREAASRVGKAIAELARGKQIEEVTFGRNGFLYSGRIKALADAAREAGLKF